MKYSIIPLLHTSRKLCNLDDNFSYKKTVHFRAVFLIMSFWGNAEESHEILVVWRDPTTSLLSVSGWRIVYYNAFLKLNLPSLSFSDNITLIVSPTLYFSCTWAEVIPASKFFTWHNPDTNLFTQTKIQ